MPAQVGFFDAKQPRQALIGKALALEAQQLIVVERPQASAGDSLLLGHQLLNLGDEPRIHPRVLMNFGDVHP